MYLESWIHQIIRNTMKRELPGRMVRSDVREYQDFMLRKTVKYCGAKSAFYRKAFRAASVDPDEFRGLADLARIPLTDPNQLAGNPFLFLCTSQAEIARPYTFVTSGTTGPKKRIFWAQYDLDRITDFMAAGIGTVANAGDTILIMLPDGRPNSQADLLYKGVKKLGAAPVVAPMDISAPELLRAVEETRCTVIFGYTRKLFRLTRELEPQHALRDKGVKILFLAAEYVPDPMRQFLQETWSCRVHTHYGLTEMGLGVAVECEAGSGYHFNEADLLLEVIDPRTGNPAAEGEEGELVFTTLNRAAMPLIRYRTHDLSRLISEPCPCGAAGLLKIDKVRKRMETIVTIGGGDEMYPALFDDLLFGIPGLTDYQVTVTAQDGRDRLDFKIELLSDRVKIPDIAKKLSAAPIVAKNLAEGKMAAPGIELVPPGSLRSVSREKKMILDRR